MRTFGIRRSLAWIGPATRRSLAICLPGKDVTLSAEFIDVNELGLALEHTADVICEVSSR